MSIRTMIEGEKTVYVGTFGDEDVEESASRHVVETKLRIRFTEKLEQFTRDSALLLHLLQHPADVDDGQRLMVNARRDALAASIFNGLWSLRCDEPAISLTADQGGNCAQRMIVPVVGVPYAPGDWDSDTKRHRDEFQDLDAYVTINEHTQGAQAAAVAALRAAGHDDETDRRLAWGLSGEYLQGTDRNADAHARALVTIAKSPEWAAAAEKLYDVGTIDAYGHDDPALRGLYRAAYQQARRDLGLVSAEEKLRDKEVMRLFGMIKSVASGKRPPARSKVTRSRAVANRRATRKARK